MKKKMKTGKIIFMALIFMMTIIIGNENVFAASKTVSDFAGLKAAITDASVTEITVNGEITANSTLEITRDIKISGGSIKSVMNGLTGADIKDGNLFYIKGNHTLTLENITIDGDNKCRLIRVQGAKLNLTNVTMKNGSTELLQQTPSNDQNYSGGAILAEEGSIVTITGGSFENNNTGTQALDGNRAAEGGAIKLYQSELFINDAKTTTKDTTKFIGNHLDGWETTGGRQGGSIEATDSKVEIYGTTFTIPGPFNTGGAIKFENCGTENEKAKVINSSFTIVDDKKPVGMAGGAITSEGSYLTIDNSTFNTGKGSYVQESGGLIQVVGTGTFDLKNSELNGSGVGWNATGANKTAKYGGAIVFYDDSTVTANIENTIIQNFTAEISGGAIALNTQIGKGEKSAVNLTIKDTKILNNVTYDFGMQAYGGGIFVGKNNTVEIRAGEISSNTYSGVGGAIYNEGKLTLTGTKENPAKIINNKAYHMAAGVLNDGELIVDFAKFAGNQKGDWSNANQHVYNKDEMAGENIYAVKDVTITPNAEFDSKDVRILDGQSKIILTGELKNQINVSISEAPKKQADNTLDKIKYPIHPKFNETQKRKVGYVVAEPDAEYKAKIEEDNAKAENKDNQNKSINSSANLINYVSKDQSQEIAGVNENEKYGAWDFIYNPRNGKIVLAQRAKVIFDPNGTANLPANLEGKQAEETSTEPFVIFSTDEQIPEMKIPTRPGYRFTGWYLEPDAGDNKSDPGSKNYQSQSTQNASVTTYSMILNRAPAASGTKTWVKTLEDITGSKAEITSILNPYEYTLYAGWEKVIPVSKVWDDNNNEYNNRATSVTVKLLINGQDSGKTATLEAKAGDTDTWTGEFTDIPNDDTGKATYSVKEVPEQITGYEKGVVTGNDIDGFTVKNSTEFITIEGSKTWIHDGNEGTKPTDVTVTLQENGVDTDKKVTGASWKFENLPKYKNKQEVKYSLTENAVENYTSTQDGYNFTNTYTNKFKVIHKFEAQGTTKDLPKAVTDLLPKDENFYEKGKEVKPTAVTTTSVSTDDGTWTFAKWDKDKDTIVDKDVTFTGTWTFKEKTSDFSITKTVDKQTYENVGDELTYTVTVTNTGEKKLENLTITDSLVNITDNTFTLDVNGEKTFTYKYTVTDADVTAKKVINTAKVKLGNKEKEATTTSNLVEKKSDFTITKTVDKSEYEKAGEVLTYKVTVKNTGEKKLEKLTISDTKVTLNEEPFNLEVGESKTFTYEYTITEGDVTAKKVENTAIVKLGDKEEKASTISKLKENKPEPQPTPEPTPQPPIIPEKPGFNPFWPIYFGSQEKYEVSEKVELNKEDHKAYMFGYPNWDFRPNCNMTRAEVTAMFARLLKNYPSTDVKYNLPYSDVFEGDWYYPAVGFMTENNIVKGYEDGTFRPNSPVTRAEFATIASKFEELIGDNVKGFSDVPTTHWALRFINSAYARGWVTGYEDGTFRPNRNITRAEVVTVTNKMLIRYADKEFVRANKGIMLHFKDLDESHWAYFNIMEATHGHDYSRRSNKLDEIWYRLNGEAFIFPDLKYYDK